jgi:hypothetical protein
MDTELTLEVRWRSDDGAWTIGAMSRTDGVIELCRSHQCGPFTTVAEVSRWITAMFGAWSAPNLGMEASESLHDAYISTAP